MIRFENVTMTYKGEVTALRDVSLDVGKGEIGSDDYNNDGCG